MLLNIALILETIAMILISIYTKSYDKRISKLEKENKELKNKIK